SSLSKATKALRELASSGPGHVQSQLWNQSQGRNMLEGLMQGLPAAVKSQDVSKEFGKALFGPSFLDGLMSGVAKIWGGMSDRQGIGGMLSKVGTGISEGFGNLISGGLTSLITGGINLLGKGISSLFGK